jgi:hypothetical protein
MNISFFALSVYRIWFLVSAISLLVVIVFELINIMGGGRITAFHLAVTLTYAIKFFAGFLLVGRILAPKGENRLYKVTRLALGIFFVCLVEMALMWNGEWYFSSQSEALNAIHQQFKSPFAFASVHVLRFAYTTLNPLQPGAMLFICFLLLVEKSNIRA